MITEPGGKRLQVLNVIKGVLVSTLHAKALKRTVPSLVPLACASSFPGFVTHWTRNSEEECT